MVSDSRVGTGGRITHVLREGSRWVEWQEKIRGIAEADGTKEAEVVRECDQAISLRD
ncbi:hypothetical protein NDI37_26665 [Funiculus sociatus GB2-A5]|uniref:Uncharacterized protein n=1 Tax=Funiculus sociatus GB2-A5 TaxID=2933946 RepID=A0ABV0JXV8_9CYAN|nr:MULTISPECIES: hypothetical protein [unclassified Trichocoleus]MBD1907400.1 hypothetical protein [Trichocoleus sp. FACHB-832]MBD2063737.1 hypothetical protein [Trichocoleus sp. FACHB-6]